MSVYTYVVDHGKNSPRISADTKINGDKILGVMFDDALEKLEKMEEFLNELSTETTCDQTRYSIDDFMN